MHQHQRPFAKALTKFVSLSSVLRKAEVSGSNDHDQQHCYHHALTVKPEAATAVELLMMGVRTPETC